MVPIVAGDLHKEHLGEVMKDALRQSRLTMEVSEAKGVAGWRWARLRVWLGGGGRGYGCGRMMLITACCMLLSLLILAPPRPPFLQEVTHIAVTKGPGLAPCLMAGRDFAKKLAEETKWVCGVGGC